MTIERTNEEIFKQEWAEMIGLYRIVASDSAMAEIARERLALRLDAHKLRVAVPTLLTMEPGKVIDRLAPRYLLKPPVVPGDGKFGPMVTAESADQLGEIMRDMQNDPRLAQMMSGSGFMHTSRAR